MIVLTRFAITPFGTFGRMRVGDTDIYTVEREWMENRPFTSCIPTGEYVCSEHVSPKFGDCWILEGKTVSHYPDPEYARNLILIHPSNRAEELAGCIAPGLRLAGSEGKDKTLHWAVGDSGAAMRHLRENLSGFTLFIREDC